jgi:glycosyltransferase involved in cell wall biosynthesis
MNVPFIFYVHEIWGARFSIKNSSDPFLQTVEFALTNAQAVVYGSEASMKVWSQQGNYANESVINSVLRIQEQNPDFQSIRLARKDFGIQNSTSVFLGVAVFEPRKRIEDLIEAFRIANIPDSVLLLVGKSGRFPDYEDRLRDLANGVTNIYLLPVSSDLPLFFEIADVFVHASQEEVFPLIIQQALGYGLPVIVAKYPGYEELLGETYPHVYQPGDVSSLALLLQSLPKIKETNDFFNRIIGNSLSKRAEDGMTSLVHSLRLQANTRIYIRKSL